MREQKSIYYGAYPVEWGNFVRKFGSFDLLPIVSNPNLKVATSSKLKDIGKVPSVINNYGYVRGYTDWTSRETTLEQVNEWASNPDYGMGVACNIVKAIDIDIDGNHELVTQIHELLYKLFPDKKFPARMRPGSSRILVPIICPEIFGKGFLRLPDGQKIEVLANGNQFVAHGYHVKSATKLLWSDQNWPEKVSRLSKDEIDYFLQEVVNRYIPDGIIHWAGQHTARERGESFYTEGEELNDPLFSALYDEELIINEHRSGVYNIICPFEHLHTPGVGNDTSTQYFAIGTEGYASSAIKCLHSHGSSHTKLDYMAQLGLALPRPPANINVVDTTALYDPAEVEKSILEGDDIEIKKLRQQMAANFHNDNEFAVIDEENQIKWLVDDMLPVKSLTMMYGPSGGGKSFVVLDMVYSIATNSVFAERHLCANHGGEVLYIAAEGAQGIRRRVNVLRRERGYGIGENTDKLVTIYDGSVDLANKTVVENFIKTIRETMPKVSLVVFDTLAVNMRGDENDSETGQSIIDNCKLLIGCLEATVLLIHHTGKDQSLGARGWSGFKAAMDSEISVAMLEDGIRSVKVTKLKDGELTGEEIPFKLEVKHTTGPMVTKARRALTDTGKLGLVVRDNEGNVLTTELNETSTVVQWRDVEMPLVVPKATDSKHLAEDMKKVLDIMFKDTKRGYVIEEFKQHAEFIGHAPQGRNRRIEAAIQRLKDDGRLRNEGERFFYIDKSNVYQFPVGDYKGGETMDATEGAPKDNDTS